MDPSGILRILGESVNGGNFKRTVTLASGEKITHHFSWSSGIGSNFLRSQYKRKFNVNVPEWVNYENPVHIHCLCSMAINNNIKLPSEKPI